MTLPNGPPNPSLRRLTVDSNAFIHMFIQHVLDEEGLDTSWTASIKNALADLGECFESGQWISGLWKMRKAQNDARALQEKVAREQARKDRERLSELKASKVKPNDKLESKEVEVNITQSKDERQSLALKEIHTLISASSTPVPPSSPDHLFITVSFQPTELPDKDFDFDLIPASKHCVFLQDMYSFPFFEDDRGKHGEGGYVVCGLDTWKRTL